MLLHQDQILKMRSSMVRSKWRVRRRKRRGIKIIRLLSRNKEHCHNAKKAYISFLVTKLMINMNMYLNLKRHWTPVIQLNGKRFMQIWNSPRINCSTSLFYFKTKKMRTINISNCKFLIFKTKEKCNGCSFFHLKTFRLMFNLNYCIVSVTISSLIIPSFGSGKLLTNQVSVKVLKYTDLGLKNNRKKSLWDFAVWALIQNNQIKLIMFITTIKK